MRKVLLFGALGALGCLLGWAGGELFLKAALPWARSFATRGIGVFSTLPPLDPPQLDKPKPQLAVAVAAPAAPPTPEPFKVEAPADPPPPSGDFALRLEREGAHSGEVEIALIWGNINDLDLHVVDPAGEEIYFGNKSARSGGRLDVDMNSGSGTSSSPYSRQPVEHVFFPKGSATLGHYKVYVLHYVDRGQDPTSYSVEVKANGQRRQYSGTISNNGQSGPLTMRSTHLAHQLVCEFDVTPVRPELRLAAPETVPVVPGGSNVFRVRVARGYCVEPVSLKLEGDIRGLTLEAGLIPQGTNETFMTVRAASEALPGKHEARLVAQAETAHGPAQTNVSMVVNVVEPPAPPPVLKLAFPDTLQVLQSGSNSFKVRLGRYFFLAAVPVTVQLDTGTAELISTNAVLAPSAEEALMRVDAAKGAPPGKRTIRVIATAAAPYTAVHAEGRLTLVVVAVPPVPPGWPMVVVVSVWTVMLAVGVALALIVGQNYYLRRRLLGVTEALKGTGGSIGAGLIAGALGQLLFQSAADIASLEVARRVAAWTLLGGLLGLGMTFFVPNLKTWRALLGGAVGGLVGGFGFLAGSGVLADFAGRLLGAVSLGFFIGSMIALAERLACNACLLVHWGPKETTTVNLGPERVILGSSSEAHIYLPKEKGFPPVTGLVWFTGGKVEFENKVSGQKHLLQNGSKLQMGTVVIEVKVADSSRPGGASLDAPGEFVGSDRAS